MRNPLSAIVQCADVSMLLLEAIKYADHSLQSIISTHRSFKESNDGQKDYRSILEATIDAAETIVQCSKHMKTIVDGMARSRGTIVVLANMTDSYRCAYHIQA